MGAACAYRERAHHGGGAAESADGWNLAEDRTHGKIFGAGGLRGIAELPGGIRAGIREGATGGRCLRRAESGECRAGGRGGCMRIPLSQPDIGSREIEYVTNVLRSGQLSLGPKVGGFEEKFADYVGTRYA